MTKLLFLLALLTTTPTSAHPLQEQEALSSYRLENPDPATLSTVSRYFEITGRQGNRYELLAPASQAALLALIAPRAEVLEVDTSAALRARLEAFRQDPLAAEHRYHSFQEVQQWMDETAAKHPALAAVVPYGTSQGGLPLRALRLSGGRPNQPAVMLTAATHGDELITTEVLLDLANRLVEGYGKETRLTNILDSYEIYFVPVVNADGFVRTQRYDNGRDPNRSYPYPEKPQQQPTKSIDALVRFFHSRPFRASIDFHAYGEMIMYPWAYTRNPVDPSYAGRFDALTRHMAAANDYTYGPISQVIYIAPGSSADYYFWKTNSLSIAVEVGMNKVPSPRDIPRYLESQRESTWRFFESLGLLSAENRLSL